MTKFISPSATSPRTGPNSNKVRNSHSSALAVGLGRQAKVPDLDDHPLGQEHVAGLQIPMYDLLAVDVGDAGDHLLHVIAGLRLRHLAPVLQHVHQALQHITKAHTRGHKGYIVRG